MGIFTELFAWWTGNTIGTRLYTWRKGERVGEDGLGNVYYQERDGEAPLGDLSRASPSRRRFRPHGMPGCITPSTCRRRLRTISLAPGRRRIAPISPALTRPIVRRARHCARAPRSRLWTMSRGSRNEPGEAYRHRTAESRAALVRLRLRAERPLRAGAGRTHLRHARRQAWRADSRSWLRRRRTDRRDQSFGRRCARRRSQR